MHLPYKLTPQPARVCTQFKKEDDAVPGALFEVKSKKPCMNGFPLPLPSHKKDYTCSVTTGNVHWYGATTGLTRYEPDASREDLVMQFYAADRDLQDNHVLALLPEGEALWVLTETGVTKIESKLVTAAEKANILLQESQKIVDRRGMYSQKELAVPRDLGSALPYGHSDNDGGFTAGFSTAEMLHYAVCRRDKGADDPETIAARAAAIRACEACLLLMHIHGRGDGFIARSYMCPDEPCPEDGVYFRLHGDKATCIDTPATRQKGSFLEMYGVNTGGRSDPVNDDAECWANMEIDASHPVPERLAKLYTDLGYTRDGIFYKADTSSDEVTFHFMQMKFAHDIIGEEDPELDELIKMSVRGLMNHIIDHNYEFCDCTGEPTTWAKWSERYFSTSIGYVDACLNSAEVLAYHKITMDILGEEGKWKESYEDLLSRGYADYPLHHWDRLTQSTMSDGIHQHSDIMYGDHMLAVISLWMLCTLEKDPVLLEKYRASFKTWRTSLAREYDPGYDIPFALACPDEEIDMDRMAQWLYRMNLSRLASGVSTSIRHDTPVIRRAGDLSEISWLLPNDERFISKFDRNPFKLCDEDSGGCTHVESCYIYTFSYWLGRYYGFFEE